MIFSPETKDYCKIYVVIIEMVCEYSLVVILLRQVVVDKITTLNFGVVEKAITYHRRVLSEADGKVYGTDN